MPRFVQSRYNQTKKSVPSSNRTAEQSSLNTEQKKKKTLAPTAHPSKDPPPELEFSAIGPRRPRSAATDLHSTPLTKVNN